jgi:membrane protein YqaA with SNARE-associated domain
MKRLRLWLLALVGPLGGLSLFVIGFFDSSIVPLPFVPDLLLVRFTIQHPRLMPYYVLMATLGSLAGCFWLYFLAKKGGEAVFRRSAGGRADRIRTWVQRYKFLGVAIPSILPPPLPFKPFILAAGVFQIPMDTFALALFVGRGLRYSLEGILAIYFGEQAIHYLQQNKLQFTLIVISAIVVVYVVWRFFSRKSRANPQRG